MSNKHGDFIWYELMTYDADAAQEFYAAVLGWSFSSAGNGDKDYRLFSMWTHYFRVSDIDVAVATIKANGGEIVQQPTDIPGGDFSMNAMDPQGAAFALVGSRK